MTDNIQLKKKVTIRTKTGGQNSSPDEGGSNGNNGSKVKWYAAALVGLLALGGGGYYLSQQGDDKPQPVVAVAETSQSDEIAKDGATEGNQNEQNQEGETPADAATSENPSGDTPVNDAPAGETPVAPRQTPAVAPASGSTPTSPSASLPDQDKPKVNSAQSKEVTGPSSATGAIEEEAKEVIRGKYGNGDVRKRNLGDRYAEIQSKVNEMYRNGQVQ